MHVNYQIPNLVQLLTKQYNNGCGRKENLNAAKQLGPCILAILEIRLRYIQAQEDQWRDLNQRPHLADGPLAPEALSVQSVKDLKELLKYVPIGRIRASPYVQKTGWGACWEG